MLHLTLEAIHTIDTIARTGSFTAAAEKLYKVPSTISYTINKLEEQMGIRFFERHGPRVALTLIGKELLDEGRCLLTAANNLESRLYHMAQGEEIELFITLDELLPLSVFLEDVRAFHASPHNTRLHFQHEVLTGTWEALMQHRADLIIAAGEGPAGGGYKTYSVGSLSFVFCVAPGHPLAKEKQPLQKNRLMQHTAIVIGDSARHLPLRTTGLYYGQPQLTVSCLADKIALQKAGLGHGFIPESCIRAELQKGELVVLPILEPKPDETFYLAWRSEDNGSALSWWRQRLSRQWLPHAIGTA